MEEDEEEGREEEEEEGGSGVGEIIQSKFFTFGRRKADRNHLLLQFYRHQIDELHQHIHQNKTIPRTCRTPTVVVSDLFGLLGTWYYFNSVNLGPAALVQMVLGPRTRQQLCRGNLLCLESDDSNPSCCELCIHGNRLSLCVMVPLDFGSRSTEAARSRPEVPQTE